MDERVSEITHNRKQRQKHLHPNEEECKLAFPENFKKLLSLTTGKRTDLPSLMACRPLLVLLRHGESMWNPPKKKKEAGKGWRYAGAMDVPLSEDGIQEAIEAGHRLKQLPLDVVYCSMLIRAQMTALIALASHDSEQTPLIVRDNPDPNSSRGLRAHLQRMHNPPAATDEETTGENEDETNRVIPVYCSHALNERDFGELQGMHSRMQRRLFRPEQLEAWRCGWLDKFPGETGESAKDVSDRVIAFFEKHIRAKLESGSNVMVVAHGFVQRVLIKHMIGMSNEEWVHHMKLEGHPDVNVRKTSKLLAQNATPVIFSYSKGVDEDKAVVRIDTFLSKMSEIFAEEEEGMYHASHKENEKKKKATATTAAAAGSTKESTLPKSKL